MNVEIHRIYASSVWRHAYLHTGRSWCDRFASDWNELVEFHSRQTIFRIKNDPISMKVWVHERDTYTKIQKETRLFPNKMYIFVLEITDLQVVLGNKIAVKTLVISFHCSMPKSIWQDIWVHVTCVNVYISLFFS